MYELQASGYHFSETTLTTWTKFEGLSVAHNFAGGRNEVTTSKDGLRQSDAEILDSLKGGFSSCRRWILSVKRREKVDSLLWPGLAR